MTSRVDVFATLLGLFERFRSQSSEAAVLPRFIDAANPLFALFIKEGWYEAAEGLSLDVKTRGASDGRPVQARGSAFECGDVSPSYIRPLSHFTSRCPWMEQPSVHSRLHKARWSLTCSSRFPRKFQGKKRMSVGSNSIESSRLRPTRGRSGLAMGTVTVVPAQRSVVPLPQ